MVIAAVDLTGAVITDKVTPERHCVCMSAMAAVAVVVVAAAAAGFEPGRR